MTAKKKPARRRTVRKWTPKPVRNGVEIMRGFPAPKGRIPLNADSQRADRVWRLYARRAVHSNDPRHRYDLCGLVLYQLHSGEPLSIGVREWLIFVLRNLARNDRLPRLAKGRPVDRDARDSGFRNLRDYLVAHANGKGKRSLEDAARSMNKSYDHLRKMFYSKMFGPWRSDVWRARQSAKRKVSR